MSAHDYSFSLDFATKPGITRDQVIQALAPVAGILYWGDDWADMGLNAIGEGVGITQNEDGTIRVEIFTGGEGSADANFELPEAIKSLNPLVAGAAVMEYRDQDTPDLESAILKIVIGEGQDLVNAQRAVLADEVDFVMNENPGLTNLEAACVKSFITSPRTPDNELILAYEKVRALPEGFSVTCYSELDTPVRLELTKADLQRLLQVIQAAKSLGIEEVSVQTFLEVDPTSDVRVDIERLEITINRLSDWHWLQVGANYRNDDERTRSPGVDVISLIQKIVSCPDLDNAHVVVDEGLSEDIMDAFVQIANKAERPRG